MHYRICCLSFRELSLRSFAMNIHYYYVLDGQNRPRINMEYLMGWLWTEDR